MIGESYGEYGSGGLCDPGPSGRFEPSQVGFEGVATPLTCPILIVRVIDSGRLTGQPTIQRWYCLPSSRARRSRHRYDSSGSPWERTEESPSVDCRGGAGSVGSRSQTSRPAEGNALEAVVCREHLIGRLRHNFRTTQEVRDEQTVDLHKQEHPTGGAGRDVSTVPDSQRMHLQRYPRPTARRKRCPSHANRGAREPSAHEDGRLLPGFHR